MSQGEGTLSACADKSLRADRNYWEKRVAQDGVERSIFLSTPEERLARFAARHEAWLRAYVPGADVLEIGCGYGRVHVPDYGPRSYVALDFVHALTVAARKRGLEVLTASARQLPFKAESFDLVLGIAVITSLEQGFQDVLAELKRVLRRPDGMVLFLEEEWHRLDYVA